MKNMFFVSGLTFVLGLVAVCAQSAFAQNIAGADVNPNAAIAKAQKLSVPATAGKKAAVGKGKTAVNTANSPGDDDSFWVESIDIDGDGTVEETEVLYDDEDKVLYLYADGDFKCKGGGVGTGGILVAVNAAGNSRNRPAGSGWYVADLDEGECKAKMAELYGCKFDAKGNATSCGVATLDEKNDDIVIVEATK